MQRKILAIIVVVIIAVAGIAAWQLVPEQSSAEARSLKIGLIACYDKAEGQDMDRAAKLAVKQINDAGGVFVSEWNAKVPIELVPADTKDDTPAKAMDPVTKVVTEDKVDLLIGGYASAGTLADQVVAIDNKVPYIITGASSNLVTRRGPQGNYGGLPENSTQRVEDSEGMSYMFHYCTTTFDYSNTVVHFFAESMQPLLNSKFDFDSSRPLKLAVIYRSDPFGQGVLADTKNIIKSENLPIEIVAERGYQTTATSFQSDLIAIKDAKPDAVYVVDFVANTAEIIKEGQKDVGLNTVYIAVECCEDPQYYTLLGSYGSGQLLESKFGPYVTPPYIPALGTYVADYQKAYNNKIPGMMGADTYDAFFVAKNAIERAGTVDKAAVRDAIEKTDMPQLVIMTQTGKVHFSTETNYHEIAPVTFVEQFAWNATLNECRPQVVYPETVSGVGTLKQTDFVLPEGYQPGAP